MDIIGIDLGTTFSCVAVVRSNDVSVLLNESLSATTPSVVAYTEAGILVGESALEQQSRNPKNTIYDVKRIIGRAFSDEVVQNEIRRGLKYDIVKVAGDKFKIGVNIGGARKLISPEEVSAHVLRYLKNVAEAHFGHSITKAVVTVPAHFNNSQREATKDACSIAGLELVRMINEPTAAAFAYGIKQRSERRKYVIIYDFGGGTLDVTLLEIEGSRYEVIAAAGNTYLGGNDINHQLYTLLKTKIIDKNQSYHQLDFSVQSENFVRLMRIVENTKKILSLRETCKFVVDFQEVSLEIEISREELETANQVCFQKILQPLIEVMKKFNKPKSMIDEVVLVGGSTRVKAVERLVSEFFEGRHLNKSINPEEAIAYGAAIQASILSEYKSTLTDDIHMLDVIPLSLGIEVIGGIMENIIEKNTFIPAKYEKLFTTARDYQTSIKVNVFEGERLMVSDNELLGSFVLRGITVALQNIPKIIVSFEIDRNSILNVTATDITNGATKQSSINYNTRRLTLLEIKEMKKFAKQSRPLDENFVQKVKAKQTLLLDAYKANRTLTDKLLRRTEPEFIQLAERFTELLNWIEGKQVLEEQEYQEKKDELNGILEVLKQITPVSRFSLKSRNDSLNGTDTSA